MSKIEIWEKEFFQKIKKIQKNSKKIFEFENNFEEKIKILKKIVKHFDKYFVVLSSYNAHNEYHVSFFWKSSNIENFKKNKKIYLNIFQNYYIIGYGLNNSKIIDIELDDDKKVFFQFQYQ